MANLMALAFIMAGETHAVNKAKWHTYVKANCQYFNINARVFIKLVQIFVEGACLSEGLIAFRKGISIPLGSQIVLGNILTRWEHKGWLTHERMINQMTDKMYCKYTLRLPSWTGVIELNKDDSREYKFLHEFRRTHGMGSYYSRFYYKHCQHNKEAELLTNTQQFIFDKEYWESLRFPEFADSIDIEQYENREGTYDLYLREKYGIKQEFAIADTEPFMIRRGDDNRLRNYSDDPLINPTSDKIDRWGLKLPNPEFAELDDVGEL
jgi:hypothetical protein